MMEEGKVTVRIQKVKKNRIRMKLFFFAALAVLLLLATIFAKQLCPYDPYAQDPCAGHEAAECGASYGNGYLRKRHVFPVC